MRLKVRLSDEGGGVGRSEVLGAIGLTLLYGAVASGHLSSFDGKVMFSEAMSLALHHSLHFAEPVPGPGFQVWNSRYGIGLSLIYAPGIALLNWLHPSTVMNAIPASSPASWKLFSVLGAPVQAFLTAGTALGIGGVVRRLGGSHGLALLGLLLYGIASPAIIYARLDLAQPLEAFLYIATIWAVLRGRADARLAWSLLAAFLLCYAVLARPVEATVLLPALLLLARRPKPIGALVLAYALGMAITVGVNWLRMGSPFVTGYGDEGFTNPLLAGIAGSLFSPGRGLLWSVPLILLVPFGVRRLWRSGLRTEVIALVYLTIGMLTMVSKWDIWWGGYDWGLRLYLPAMPVVVILGVLGISELQPVVARAGVGVIALAGTLWSIPGVLVNGYPSGGPIVAQSYESMADGTAGSWKLAAYPPIGAWQFLHGWLGTGPIGTTSSADVLWLSLSRPGYLTPLLGMAIFGGAAVACLLGSVVAWRRGVRVPERRYRSSFAPDAH